ncbi:MAG: phosphoribosylglycinamide formyltransferase [Promethearchaeota archaeon]
MRQRVVILGSEEKEILVSLVSHLKSHRLAELVSVIFDRPCPTLARSLHQLGYELQIIPYHKISCRNRDDYEQELLEEVIKTQPDWIFLCGYSWILPEIFVNRFKWRILNIHPSLLPAFPGANAIEDAWWWGVKLTGVTIHFVDESIDMGPIILQEAYYIKEEDDQQTIYDNLVKIGKRLYRKVIDQILKEKVHINGRKVAFEDSKW